jgi:hypothetical protein
MDAISEIGYPIPKSAGGLHARPRRLKLSVLSLLTVQPCPIQRPVYGCGHRLLVKRAAQELVYPPGSRLWIGDRLRVINCDGCQAAFF